MTAVTASWSSYSGAEATIETGDVGVIVSMPTHFGLGGTGVHSVLVEFEVIDEYSNTIERCEVIINASELFPQSIVDLWSYRLLLEKEIGR